MFLFTYIYLLIIYVEYPQIFRGVPHFEARVLRSRAWLGLKHDHPLIICENPALSILVIQNGSIHASASHCGEQFPASLPSWQDAKGCRDVQRAIEEAADDVTRSRLVTELAGHVLDAMRCPHANHVLQKCITCSRPGKSDVNYNVNDGV